MELEEWVPSVVWEGMAIAIVWVLAVVGRVVTGVCWVSPGEWSVASCVCSRWFLFPDIGEGTNRCSGRGYQWFIRHWILDLDLGCDVFIRGEYPHRTFWV